MELNGAEKVYRLLSTKQITPPIFYLTLHLVSLTFVITLVILFFIFYGL